MTKGKQPIESVREALELLEPKWGRWVGAVLNTYRYHNGLPQISVYWAGREYRDPPPSVYTVSEAVVGELIKKHYVETIGNLYTQ